MAARDCDRNGFFCCLLPLDIREVRDSEFFFFYLFRKVRFSFDRIEDLFLLSAQHRDHLPEILDCHHASAALFGCQTALLAVAFRQIYLRRLSAQSGHHRQHAAHPLYLAVQF